MGSKTSKVESNTFSEQEMESLKKVFSSFSKNNKLDILEFQKKVFYGLYVRPLEFLNTIFVDKKLAKISDITFDDFVYLAYVLSKMNQSSEDTFGFYDRKNTIQILYDLVLGKYGLCDESLRLDVLLGVISFSVDLFNSVQKNKLEFDRKKFEQVLQNSILTEGKTSVTFSSIRDFSEHILYNLEPYLKSYFTHVFLKESNHLSFTYALPIYTTPSNFLTIDQYFSFLILNPHLFGKPHAFKLYDCSKQGFNIPELIYSFLGFGGPVGIFIEHLEVKTKEKHVFGVYINSNFKDCYENFCGDDLSFLFSLSPKLEIYKYGGSCKNIVYLCRRAQNFSKMVPGIGIGYNTDGYKLWLDANELFKKSYFRKYDETFDSGTPFPDDIDHPLNITSIEVFGFGNEESYKALMKKQKKDRDVSEKMKQVDKAQFVENEFDKEMFLGNTFSHQKDVYK